MSDYYSILEIERNASKDEIKRAFRKKARQLHPDVNKAPDAEEKFKELGKAYETLVDDDKRAVYDRYGEDGLQNSGYTNQGPFDFGFGGLNDIFESFFGGGFSGMGGFEDESPNAPKRGSDLRMNIKLKFEEAIFGIEKEIKVEHLEKCEACHGSGCKDGTTPIVCPTCKGHGRIQQTTRTALGSFTQVTMCPHCNGTGQKIEQPCPKCHGVGRVETEKTIKVKIPQGVDNGAKIRISGEGDCGINGGLNGDLYLVIYVEESNKYIRDGYNIHSKVEITMPQAVLGDEVKVETLDGEKLLKIPPSTQYGKILTLKYHGVPFLGSNNKRGDHFVQVIIKTPNQISDEERKLYAKLYELQSKKQAAHNDSIIDKVKQVLGSGKD